MSHEGIRIVNAEQAQREQSSEDPRLPTDAVTPLKVTAACLSNFCAVVTFIFGGAIEWRYCLVSMVFAAVGGYVGAQYARRMSAGVLRSIVVVTGCAVAAYFFWRQP